LLSNWIIVMSVASPPPEIGKVLTYNGVLQVH
jgi:hypothetical protein